MKNLKCFLLILALILSSNAVFSQQGRLPTQEEIDIKMALAQLYKSNAANKSVPNHLAITGPEQNCANGIPVCQQSYSQNNSYTGHGSIQEVSGTCLSSQETNSVWYIFTVQNSGTFTFMLNTSNDYDFALYDITTMGCGGIPSATPIRCNYSSTYGSTGLTLPTAGGNMGYSASQVPTMPGINVNAGQTFALIIDNYSANSNGYTLTFGSGPGSASIFDVTPPTISSSSSQCNSNVLGLNFSELVKCTSINASDFTITGPGSVNVPVLGVAGTQCGSSANTNGATVTFDNTGLVTGTYTVNVITGSDGNTMLDKCGNVMGTQTFTFQYLGPISISATNTIVCAGSPSTLSVTVAGNPSSGVTYAWSPVSGSGSSLTVNPNITTNYVATVTYGGCSASVSQVITVGLPPVVYVNPANTTLCSGTTTITASATMGGAPCLNCNYTWSGSSTQVDNAVPASTVTGAGPGSYSVSVVSDNGCVGNTAVANVSIITPGSTPACNIIYASPAGGGNGLTPTSPTDLQTAVTLGACNSIVIKMQVGDYTINNPLNIGSFTTLEGGYDVGFNNKTSGKATTGGFPVQGTRILRSLLNPEGIPSALRYTALNVSPTSAYFRIQDIMIQMPNAAVGSGISNYGVYLGAGCNNYDITRCYINSGNAGSGATGTTGATGAAGSNGSGAPNGFKGAPTSGAGTSGAGGKGGGLSGGNGGTAVTYASGAALNGVIGSAPGSSRDGGGGASGGTGVYNASSPAGGGAGSVGARGGLVAITGGPGGAGGAGITNTSAGCGFSAACEPPDLANSTTANLKGTNGSNGAVGATGTGAASSGYWVPGQGGTGADGIGGAGGGGGGGGGGGFNSASTSGCGPSYGTSAGGAGGGGGGQGGAGGIGGGGGGATYGVFIFNNGANGNIVDCQITNGTPGSGGIGGAGGAGGAGGLGGVSASVNAVGGCAYACDNTLLSGDGGIGGAGGNGGQGGQGGTGGAGEAVLIKLVGGSALVTSSTTFTLTTQPIITVENKACTNVNIAHTSTVTTPSWSSFGPGASPTSGSGSPASTVYSTTGRKTITLNTSNYTDFNNIIVAPPSTGNIIASATSICPGVASFASSVAGTAGLNYVWSVAPGTATISSAATSSTSISFSNTGSTPITYTVTLTITSNCCGALIPITTTITVEPLPTDPIASVNPICLGGTATYSVSAPVGASFAWYNAATSGTLVGTGTTYSVPNISGPTTVYVQASNSAGCTSSLVPVVVTPTVVPPPTVVDGSSCDIGSVPVSINPVPGATDYNWYSNPGGTVLVQNGTSLNYAENIATAGGSYTVYVQTNITGCTPSVLVPVTASVSSTPITLAQTISPNDTVCPNVPVTFSLTPGGGNGTFTYTWSPFTSNSNTTVQTFTASQSVNVLITSNGCTSQFYLPIIVNSSPKDTIRVPALITCASPTITLDGSLSDSGPNITYNWATTNGSIVSPTNANTVSVNTAGTYSLIVTNTITGCSSVQNVTVSGNSTIPSLTVTPLASTLTCITPSVQITVAAAPSNDLTYSWTASVGGVLDNTTISNPIASSSGTYVVVVTNTVTGCQSTETVVIVPDAAAPTATISPSTASLTCSMTTQSATVTTTPSSNINYSWSPNPASGGNTPTPTFSATGTYVCLITNTTNSCTTSTQITIGSDTVSPTVSISPTPSITCFSPTVTINSVATPSTGVTYAWSGSGIVGSSTNPSVDVTVGGNYSVVVLNSVNGCTATANSSVASNTTQATLSVAPTGTVITCNTATVSLDATTNSTIAPVWSTPSGTSSDPLSVTAAGDYTVTVTEPTSGCVTTQIIPVTVNTVVPSADAGSNATINCGSSTVNLSGSSTSTNNISYSWSGPGVVSGGLTQTPTVNQTGDYTLTVRDVNNGCSSTSTVTVNQGTIAAAFTADPTTGPAPLTVNFTDASTGAVGYNWSFGDGNTSTAQNPGNVFVTNGVYTVTLVISSGVCTATATADIIVQDGLSIEIPNVFTPNGDGKNEMFFIRTTGVKELSLQIFNRWGEKLHDSSGINQGWGGDTASGAKVPEGTYFYFVKATSFDDKIIEKHGTVTLFR